MIDFIMAVTHPHHWHSLNMAQHPRHYAMLSRLLGGIGISLVQPRGAKIWYNPYIKLDDELVKYGIISVDDLCTDLLDWETLYVSGRMHKPVALVTSDARVRLAQQVNLASALRTALLLLPREFSEVELYTRIASLSYTGDFRMSVPGGENANKVRNIVLNQREEFRRLYAGLMRNLGTLSIEEVRENRFRIVQDVSASTRASYAARLPRCLRQKVQDHYTSQPDLDPAFLKLSLSKTLDTVPRRPSSIEREEILNAFWKAAVQRDDFGQVLLQKISQTVKGPAWSQSIKGVYTAGLTRTLRYVAAKIGKVSSITTSPQYRRSFTLIRLLSRFLRRSTLKARNRVTRPLDIHATKQSNSRPPAKAPVLQLIVYAFLPSTFCTDGPCVTLSPSPPSIIGGACCPCTAVLVGQSSPCRTPNATFL